MADQQEPKIVVFFSFKGGVGRSLALLNVGYLLAGMNRRVLMVDADLEAPGLTVYLMGENRLAKRGGFVDVLTECAMGDQPPTERYVWDRLLRVDIPRAVREGDEGYLYLLPAGKLDGGYARRLNRWKDDKLQWQDLGDTVRSLLQEVEIHDFEPRRGFDYVLIDSRTGFADIGGFCANLLADSVVLLSSLNDQNLFGTSSVLARLRQDKDERDLAVVLSPVPVGEEDLKLKRVEKAREIFETKEDVQLPYHPRVALVEEPFCAKFPDAELTRAYRRLQNTVRAMADDDERAWSDRVREALSEQDHDGALRALEELRLLDEDAARQYLRAVTMAEGVVESWGEDLNRYFAALVDIDAEDPITFFNWGLALQAWAGRKEEESDRLFEEACRKYARAVEIKPDYHEAFYNWGNALTAWAKRKGGEASEDLLREAREKFRLAGGREGIRPAASFNSARAAALLGEREGMLEDLEVALEEVPDHVNLAEELEDFAPYRDDEEFSRIVREARERADDEGATP